MAITQTWGRTKYRWHPVHCWRATCRGRLSARSVATLRHVLQRFLRLGRIGEAHSQQGILPNSFSIGDEITASIPLARKCLFFLFLVHKQLSCGEFRVFLLTLLFKSLKGEHQLSDCNSMMVTQTPSLQHHANVGSWCEDDSCEKASCELGRVIPTQILVKQVCSGGQCPLLWPAEYKANRNIVRHEWGLVWSQSHTLCLVSIHSSNGHWISAHCICARPKRGRYWEIHPRCLRGRRGWISQYLPSFCGVRTFSQHQFFYREWIRKYFPVVREGLTVLKSLLPCWWENAQYSFNVRRDLLWTSLWWSSHPTDNYSSQFSN